ncbi:MAG: hypothetical protein SynsKO_35960 [Synoicihabitans sp.]
MRNWVKKLEHRSFGPGKYSQSYQDELLEVIFENIGTRNASPFCVEFGFNSTSLVRGSGANVSRLILERDWDSLLLDGGFENEEINLFKHFLTSSNICEFFRKYNVPSEPEYVSIDVDSTDLWLFKAVVEEYRAMVFSVEYNSHFPFDAAITFPNDPTEISQNDRGYGASLKALNIVAEANGYSLLWVVPPLDAFFIRNDLIDDQSDQISFPLERWRTDMPYLCHRPLKDPQRAKIFLDYEVYLSTNGDTHASQQAALPTCTEYLSTSTFQRTIWKAKQIAKFALRPGRS